MKAITDVGPGRRQLEEDSACTSPDPASPGLRLELKGEW